MVTAKLGQQCSNCAKKLFPLQDICCSSQHTYAHAQQLLKELGAQPQGARFKRLSQDMEVYAAEKLSHPIAWKMHQ